MLTFMCKKSAFESGLLFLREIDFVENPLEGGATVLENT